MADDMFVNGLDCASEQYASTIQSLAESQWPGEDLMIGVLPINRPRGIPDQEGLV